jgi:hypothetical protein
MTDLNPIEPGLARMTGNFLGVISDRSATAGRETLKLALWH